MTSKLYWLFAFVGIYWAYCLFWGLKRALRSRTSADYFVAGRSIGLSVFVLAAMQSTGAALDTLRHRFIQRAGRLTLPQGELTLTLSPNPMVQHDLLHFLDALQKAA